MKSIYINGGKKLSGEVSISGAKNAALPILAAGLLCEGEHRISNVPVLADVITFGKILQNMGVAFERQGHEIRLDAGRLTNPEAPYDLVRTMRASVLVLGPLVARMGRARVSLPGGCAIGARPINLHLMGLEKLGARVAIEHGYVIAEAKRLRGAHIYFDTVTVTGTENLMMAAALADGETVLENAAREPEITDLANALVRMGAKIEGAGTDVITIQGVETLRPMDYAVMPDRIETGTFVIAAAITSGEILIRNAAPEHLGMVRMVFEKLGVHFQVQGSDVLVPAEQPLTVVDDLGGAVPKIDDAPWPGFPSDLMSIALVVATQARGTVLIHEKMYDSRLYFVDRLIGMGARIILCDPHRAVVVGPAQLHGETLQSPDIRAGMALLIAALSAAGQSIIYNISQIDRGYEQIESKLQGLGAKISRE